jgi:FixJ family two-component response regulator
VTRKDQTVFVVDDDPDAGESLRWLARTIGLAARTFSSAGAFLQTFDPGQPGCVVTDVRMPDMDGFALLAELRARGASIPVIFVTAYGDVVTAVRALKLGAVDYLEKPVSDHLMVECIQGALKLDARTREHERALTDVAQRLARLTPRERGVLELVADGKTTKLIAEELHVSTKTVEFHRANLKRKLGITWLKPFLQAALRASGR